MNNIPEPLKASPQWVLWRYGEPRPDGKRAKPPVDLHGRMIDPHKPEHWLEFSEAQAALQEEGGLFAGLGFVLSADDPFTCIDLDNCLDAQGRATPEAQALVDRFNSYTEVSPSGRGLHIWITGRLARACKRGHIELYDRARYMTMTGRPYGKATRIRACQRALAALLARLEQGAAADTARAPETATITTGWQGVQLDNGPLTAADEALIERIRAGRQGSKFDALMRGDTSAYGGDSSAADLALASLLAWHTKGDTRQACRIFGVSELAARDKWQTRPDYQQRTLWQGLQNQPTPQDHNLTTGGAPAPPPPMVNLEDEETLEAALSALVEAAREDCGAPFATETLALLAELKKKDKPRFMRLRQELKQANPGVILGELGRDIRAANRAVRSKAATASPPVSGSLAHLPPEVAERVGAFSGCLLTEDDQGNESLVPQSTAALRIGAALRGIYAWSETGLCWHHFNGSHWEKCPAVSFDRAVTALLLAGTGDKGFSHNYELGVVQLIQKLGGNLLPQVTPGHIPFANGLLDLATRTLIPASPDNADTWCLPYRYEAGAQCPGFQAWLHQAVDGDADTVQLLRGWINALLTGRPDLQYFLHLQGAAGTGKSTFGRLVFKLIGQANSVTTTLKELEQNRFETAGIHGKRLVAVEDADKYGGSVNILKAMTGRDPLRLERKNQQQEGAFIFEGQTLIMSNERLATTDYTSGIERRRITVAFQRRISPEERAAWEARGGEEAILHAEIPGIIEWALALSQEEVTAIFKRQPERVLRENLEAALFNNPVADWMLHNLLPDPKAATQVGNKQEDRGGGITIYHGAFEWLYANYLTWCLANGREQLALRRFSETLIDAARTHGVAAIKSRTGMGGTRIHGLRLRKEHEKTRLDRRTAPQEEWQDVRTGATTGHSLERSGNLASLPLGGFFTTGGSPRRPGPRVRPHQGLYQTGGHRMMLFKVDNAVRLSGHSSALERQLRNTFSIENPRAIEAERMGRWFDPDEQYLHFWHHEQGALVVPRGAARTIMQLAKQFGEVEVDDRRVLLPPCGCRFIAQLRPYQQQAVQGILGREFGVLEAGTGSGKTVMALAIIAARKQPTLILVHTKELLYQWQERIRQFLGIEAGLIGDGHLDPRQVTVGIVNTVRKHSGGLFKRFGHVVVDECHRVPSTLFSEALAAFPSRYMLGLSATPYRRDGLSSLIYWFVREHRVTVDQATLHQVGAVLRPKVQTIETAFRYQYENDYQDMISSLVTDKARNALVADCISQATSHGQVLVTSDRVAHLQELARLSGYGADTILTGKTPAKQRRAMVERIRSGELPVSFSTLSLIGEGFDAASLSVLVLASPVKFKGRLLQTVGRVLRPQGGEAPCGDRLPGQQSRPPGLPVESQAEGAPGNRGNGLSMAILGRFSISLKPLTILTK